jgi:hypothetical protein
LPRVYPTTKCAHLHSSDCCPRPFYSSSYPREVASQPTPTTRSEGRPEQTQRRRRSHFRPNTQLYTAVWKDAEPCSFGLCLIQLATSTRKLGSPFSVEKLQSGPQTPHARLVPRQCTKCGRRKPQTCQKRESTERIDWVLPSILSASSGCSRAQKIVDRRSGTPAVA